MNRKEGRKARGGGGGGVWLGCCREKSVGRIYNCVRSRKRRGGSTRNGERGKEKELEG